VSSESAQPEWSATREHGDKKDSVGAKLGDIAAVTREQNQL
jgi:hypothetical protein